MEIKGQKSDNAVVLDGNEPEAVKAAKRNGEPFWLCIATGIPENPQLWVVEDVSDAGSSGALTIQVSKWKTFGRRVV